MAQDVRQFPLAGGLDLVTPAMGMPPGRMIAGSNHESTQRGYRRIDGYERFDGQPKPSEAHYWTVSWHLAAAQVAAGGVVTGITSGATGVALQDATLTSGAFDGTGAGYLVLGEVVGAFVIGEHLHVGATDVGVTTTISNEDVSPTGLDADETAFMALSIEARRALIGVVPGSGKLRGVWMLNGTVYAFRDNAGGTAGLMWKATAAGWVAVDLGRKVAFTSGGVAAIARGVVVTGTTSGATATVAHVELTGGTFAGGDAAGVLFLGGQVGAFVAENLNVPAQLNIATLAGNSAAIALLPGGRYDFDNFNFLASAGTTRMYGCDGVNKAFEFDGTLFAQITTGVTDDTPDYIAAHKFHLLTGFKEGSIMTSGFTDGVADPFSYVALTGAAEIGVGHEVTGLMPDVNGAAVILGRNSVHILYGSGAGTDDPWKLDTQADDTGGHPFTAQKVGSPFYLDNIGVRTMSAVNAYGNFSIGPSVTRQVLPLFESKRKLGVDPTASIRCRTKGQYRVFFDDGTGLTLFLEKKTIEPTVFNFPLTVQCACSVNDVDGQEFMFFGSDDGYVFQLDAGNSFDGAAVPAYCRLSFANLGSPQMNKRWHKIVMEVDASAGVEMSIMADFGYGDPDLVSSLSQDFTITGGGGFWDEMNWNEFLWSSAINGLAEAFIDGTGANISAVVVSNLTYEDPYTLQGERLYFSTRGLIR